MKKLLFLSAILFYSANFWAAAEADDTVYYDSSGAPVYKDAHESTNEIPCEQEPVIMSIAGGLIKQAVFIPLGQRHTNKFFLNSAPEGYCLYKAITTRASHQRTFFHTNNDTWRCKRGEKHLIFYRENRVEIN